MAETGSIAGGSPIAHSAMICLGSNIQAERHLPLAAGRVALLGQLAGVSQVWQSAPKGFAAQADFLNAAALLETTLSPTMLRRALKLIELELGRQRDPSNPNGPRTIDLDIAVFDDLVEDFGGWRLPDPDIAGRAFLAAPLAQLQPERRPAAGGPTLREMADNLAAQTALMRIREDVSLDVSVAAVRIGGDLHIPWDLMRAPPQLATSTAPLASIELRFCYGHRLLNYDGKCRHLHGHSARVELLLDAAQTPEDWQRQRQEIGEWIDDTLNARMILCHEDPALPALRELGEPVHLVDSNPTTENIARMVFEQAERLGLPAVSARMWESPRCSAVYLP